MASSTKNLTLEFMQTEQGQYSKYKFRAILGLKYNHQNPFSHNFLTYFQNIKTGFPEIIEVSPELLRYKFKLGHIYQKEREISKPKNHEFDYLRIDTQKLKQKPLFTLLKKETIQNEIINTQEHFKNKFNNISFQYGGNNCYEHFENGNRYIIPSYVINLYYYMRSSSMKDALFKGKIESLYNEKDSDLSNKKNATLILKRASMLDGAFIYRFITNKTSNFTFSDLFRYITSFKSKLDAKGQLIDLIPIKSLFPTKEVFNIKARYEKLENETNTYIVHQIINDDSTLDFEKLIVLKTIKKDKLINPSIDSFPIKGRKPKTTKPIVNTKTPYSKYGISIIKAIENEQNMSLQNKVVMYGNIEDNNNTKTPFETDIEEIGDASISFSTDKNSGDKTAKSHKIEQKGDKEEVHRPTNFDIFLESIEFIENSSLVNNFYFNNNPQNVPISYTKYNKLTSQCSINNKLKEYVTCSFEYNDINVVLIEVESGYNDFATWVISSKNEISIDDIVHILEMRYKNLERLDSIKKIYNNLNTKKFFTHKHAQINDENEHEEVFERWLIRLLYKLIQ